MGRQPGLRVSSGASILWLSDDDVACELWVSADNRLIPYRPAGAEEVRVSRGGRSLQAPFAKPVVLLDQDELAVGARHFRIHVHGPAPRVAAPSALPDPAPRQVACVAAVMAIGARRGQLRQAGGYARHLQRFPCRPTAVRLQR
ncbi:MAG: hypothetical protein ACOC1F_11140 [Myxococcota bacterium]